MLTLLMLGIGGFIISLGTAYDIEVPEVYKETFNNYAQLESDIYDSSETLEGGDIDTEAANQAVYSDSIVASKQVGQSANLAKNALNQMVEQLHISTGVIAIFSLIIVVLIAASLIALFMGGRSP